MSKDNRNILDDNEVMTMIVGFMVGVGVLALPNLLVKDAKQDGWIAAFIGIIYPLVICFSAVYLCKYYPEDNILVLSKKYLGNVIGTICNFLFMSFFLYYMLSAILAFTNIFRVYADPFLTPLKMQIVIMIVIIYTYSKGLKALAKINEFSFMNICVLMIVLTIALVKGNILNIKPILGSGVKNILKASIESAYSYAGIEQILLIYPFIKNKNKLKSAVLKGVFTTAIFYTWITFISIYFLGYKITGINLWPVFLVTESVVIPLINSFKSLYLLSWTVIMCTLLSNEYFALIDILSYIFNVKKKKKLHIITVPVIIYFLMKVPNQIYRKAIIKSTVPIITIYSFVYIGIIVLLVFLDKDKAHNIK